MVNRVRPDISLDKLWIIQSDDFRRSTKSLDTSVNPGIENLFKNARMYRRIRNLTAGRQAFILPGVMEDTDVFLACELKIPIIGEFTHFRVKNQVKIAVLFSRISP